MVYRVFVEKKDGLQYEAASLKRDVNRLLGIKGVTGVRVLNRYDAENLPKETFDFAVKSIFAEPQIDNAPLLEQIARRYVEKRKNPVISVQLDALTVPAHVTLDLNGGTLTVKDLASFGDIIDTVGTGSLVAERIFGENERVVSAIHSHTTGKAGRFLTLKRSPQ